MSICIYSATLVSMVKQSKTSIQWADVFNGGWSRGSTGCGHNICNSTTMGQLVIDFCGIIYDMPKPYNPNDNPTSIKPHQSIQNLWSLLVWRLCRNETFGTRGHELSRNWLV